MSCSQCQHFPLAVVFEYQRRADSAAFVSKYCTKEECKKIKQFMFDNCAVSAETEDQSKEAVFVQVLEIVPA